MSRVKRLKKSKRKTIVKATVCGIALSLSIASLQGLGTYASFADKENIYNNLSISAGDVDVKFNGDGFNTELENGKEYVNEFDILNNGTLNQKLYLGFDDFNEVKFPKELKYRLQISYGGKVIDNIIKTGEELQKPGEIEIKDNGNDFILKAGEKITCKAYVKLDSTGYDDLKGADNFSFDLKVKATQIGFKNTGFYDIESQKNELSVAKHQENEDGQEVIFEKCKHCGLPAVVFDCPEEVRNAYAVSLPSDEDKPDGFSVHEKREDGKIVLVKRDENKYHLEKEDVLDREFEFKFALNHEENKTYVLTCKEVNGKIIGKWTKIERETSNAPQNNKVQAPDKPQEVESSKEEVKVPVKPEVVESTKGEDKEQQGNAQEEQSQKEEVKAQGESQEVESSKEEVEVPKKSDVVNP